MSPKSRYNPTLIGRVSIGKNATREKILIIENSGVIVIDRMREK